MTARKIYGKFLRSVNKWERALPLYSVQDLDRKPDQNSWSIGQLYEHLVRWTLNFHIKQVEQCLSSDSNNKKKKNFLGYLSLCIKTIPPVNIKIPPEEYLVPAQPKDKGDITKGMEEVKNKLADLVVRIDHATMNGKIKHPAFGYLSAKEIFEFIEMHFRLHLRDKKRIDAFLYK